MQKIFSCFLNDGGDVKLDSSAVYDKAGKQSVAEALAELRTGSGSGGSGADTEARQLAQAAQDTADANAALISALQTIINKAKNHGQIEAYTGIPDGADLNDYTEDGFFTLVTGISVSNSPENLNMPCYLEVANFDDPYLGQFTMQYWQNFMRQGGYFRAKMTADGVTSWIDWQDWTSMADFETSSDEEDGKPGIVPKPYASKLPMVLTAKNGWTYPPASMAAGSYGTKTGSYYDGAPGSSFFIPNTSMGWPETASSGLLLQYRDTQNERMVQQYIGPNGLIAFRWYTNGAFGKWYTIQGQEQS